MCDPACNSCLSFKKSNIAYFKCKSFLFHVLNVFFYKHEPLDCCEPLVDCCDPLLIPTNEAGPNILIENDQEIKTLDHIQDCQKIEVYNCQQITRIPSNLDAFQCLSFTFPKGPHGKL